MAKKKEIVMDADGIFVNGKYAVPGEPVKVSDGDAARYLALGWAHIPSAKTEEDHDEKAAFE